MSRTYRCLPWKKGGRSVSTRPHYDTRRPIVYHASSDWAVCMLSRFRTFPDHGIDDALYEIVYQDDIACRIILHQAVVLYPTCADRDQDFKHNMLDWCKKNGISYARSAVNKCLKRRQKRAQLKEDLRQELRDLSS
jgi:hypothetical protein